MALRKSFSPDLEEVSRFEVKPTHFIGPPPLKGKGLETVRLALHPLQSARWVTFWTHKR